MKITIATWNINSIRLRLPLLSYFVSNYNPDIIALQETKVDNDKFPYDDCKKLGYEHVIYDGEKSYNGVTILSKLPLSDVRTTQMAGGSDCRHISAQIHLDSNHHFELHNFYIPAGGDEPDPVLNPKYDYKLRYVADMASWFQSNRSKNDNIVILGDFNIAPYEHDVWSHRQLRNVVSHTEPEIRILQQLKESLDWIDVARYFVDEQEKLYSWWSYRARDWQKSNRGRRLDHIWVTPVMEQYLHSIHHLSEMRGHEKPSDHVPVMLELEI